MIEQAKKILLENRRKGYTIPSPKLYPFQWNWDAGFIALGLVHIDPQLVMEEIDNMFKGQWSNGMLPHINFHYPDANYFPGPEVWRTAEIPEHSKLVQTSGITQPPVFGFVLERLDNFLKEKPSGWETFLRETFHKVVSFHRYLYNSRDPQQEGLVYIHHNWEAGTDNSPVWDEIFDSMDVSHARDVSALRCDIKNVDASQRPSNENYKRYIYLVDLFIKHSYKDKEIVKECPFLVQDILFNSLLVKSNEGLISMAKKLHLDASEIETWNAKTVKAINTKLWDQKAGFYFNYDLKSRKQIPIKISSGFAPLFAGICSDQQVEKLAHHLTHSFIQNSEWKLCPSTAADETHFNPVKYWRGPVWINMNWIIYHGLLRYDKIDLSERIKADSLSLLEKYGMYEYFDARPEFQNTNGIGLGGNHFSWSAALYLDMVLNENV